MTAPAPIDYSMVSEPKDWLGQPLTPGDFVALIHTPRSSSNFTLGVVVGSTPKQVRIFFPEYRSYSTATRDPHKLLKVTPTPAHHERHFEQALELRRELYARGFPGTIELG